MEKSHDRILSECFTWCWNKYPQTRYTMFHVMNESKPISTDAIRTILIEFIKWLKVLSKFRLPFIEPEQFDKFISSIQYDKEHIRRMSQMKAIGVVPGVTDLIWYWKGKCIALDAKIGTDRLSESQKTFISAITAQGGCGYTFCCLEDFIKIIEKHL